MRVKRFSFEVQPSVLLVTIKTKKVLSVYDLTHYGHQDIMNNDDQPSFGGSQASSQTGESLEPLVNPARWMTDIAADIGHLKLHQLALPSAHNSAADMKKLWGFEELLAACQDDSFDYQLNLGIRVFDFRPHDGSYEIEGVLLEKVVFHHGIVTIDHQLMTVINIFKRFAASNRGEILTLDIGHFSVRTELGSIARCVDWLKSFNDVLLPPAARDMTLQQIRENYPGKNIIIRALPKFRELNLLYWPLPKSVWTGDDASLENLIRLTNKVNDSLDDNGSLVNRMWNLQANARNLAGPIRLKYDHSFWLSFFKRGSKGGLGQKCNVVNADFMKDNRLVDFCITENRYRGTDSFGAIAPRELTMQHQPAAGEPDNKNKIKLSWQHYPLDSRMYRFEIYGDDRLVGTTASTNYSIAEPYATTYKVRHVSITDVETDFSTAVATPPEAPTYLRLIYPQMTRVDVLWDPPSNVSGMDYEFRWNDSSPIYTKENRYNMRGLDPATEYRISVRTRNQDRFSEAKNIVLLARPGTPKQPRHEVTTNQDTPINHKKVTIFWRSGIATDYPYAYRVRVMSPFGESLATHSDNKGESHYILNAAIDKTYSVYIFADLHNNTHTLSYTFKVPISPPQNLTVSHLSSSSATINYSPAAQQSHAKYMVSLNAAPAVPVMGLSHTFTGLEDGTTYNVMVQAVGDAGGLSAPTATAFRTPDATTPGRPVNLLASNFTPTSARLTWAAPPTTGVTGYRISLNGATAIPVTTLSHTFSGLSQGSTYSVEVKAEDAQGKVSKPASLTFNLHDVTAPSQPGTPVPIHIGGSVATLAWTKSTDNIAVVGYKVSLDGASPSTVEDLNHTFRNLQANTTYSVDVRAFDAANNLSDAALTTFKTEADDTSLMPGNLRVTANANNKVKIEWDVPTDARAIKDYRVFVGFFPVYVTDRVITLSFLPGIKQATFQIATRYESGIESADSVIMVSLNPASPAKPGNPVLSNITGTSAKATWAAPNTDCVTVGYRVSLDGASAITATGLTHTFSGLKDATTYRVDVWAVDAAGNMSEPASATFSTRDITPPGKPPSLDATLITSTSATLVWTASSDNVAVTGYQVSLDNNQPISVNGLQHTFNQLIKSTSYNAHVKAIDAAGNQSTPTSVTFTTAAVNITPQNLRVVGNTGGIVKLEWDAPEAEGFENYLVYIFGVPLNHGSSKTLELRYLPVGSERTFSVAAKYTNDVISDPASIIFTVNP
jgi:chitodextrinase